MLSISRTRDGIVWVGSANTGVNWCDENSMQFKLIKQDESKPYVNFCCWAANDSALLVGTENGIDEFKCFRQEWFWQKHFFNGHKVTALFKEKNNLWIGTSNGLFIQNESGTKEINLKKLHLHIFEIKQNKSNALMISSIQGLFILDRISKTIIKHIDKSCKTQRGEQFIKSNYLFNTTLTSGNDYFLNTTVGVAQLDSNFEFKRMVFKLFKYKSLSEIMITKSLQINNAMWYGSLGNGVYEEKNDSLKIWDQTKGLSNNVVASMEADDKNNLWLSTNYGINCIAKDFGVKSFVQELNMQSPEFMTNGSFKTKHQLFFCSNSGVVTFQPDKVLMHTAQIQDLKLQLISAFKNYTDSLTINDSTLELNFNDKTLQLTACVPSIRYFNQVRLSYQIKKINDAWIQIENGKMFQLANLPYGNYAIIVKAELPGTNLQQQLKLSLNVKPPFWKRTWFIILITLIALIIISLTVWYLSNLRLKKQLLQLQIQQKVHEEKERISRDLHDNIGTQISALISGLDKISITGKSEQAEKLSDYARRTLDELRETIWALNTGSVDLETLKQKLEELVFNWRTAYPDISIELNSSFKTNENLNPEQTLSYYRILQEAGTNALKHANCKCLTISLSHEKNKLFAILKDDGKGFDINYRKKGHYGLDNMKVRATMAQIAYDLKSELNQGTEIILTLSLPDKH